MVAAKLADDEDINLNVEIHLMWGKRETGKIREVAWRSAAVFRLLSNRLYGATKVADKYTK